MSLVIAAITANNDIVMCADSRIVDKNDNIVSENENKIYQISDKCMIGYAGNKNAFDCLKAYLEIKSIILDTNNVDSVYDDVMKYMYKNKPDLHLIVTGFDKENSPKLYVILSNGIIMRKFDLSKAKYMGVGDCDFNLEINMSNTTNTVIHDINQIICDRAKVNKTVNNIINQVTLKQ